MKRLFIFFILICANFSVQAEYFKITNYDIQIEVSKEGYFDVEETIDVHFFEKRHGIIWNIPYQYFYGGKKRSLSFTNIYVKGYRFKESYDDRYLNLRIGNSFKWVNGNQRYIINYRVYNAFINKETYQKLHWNLVGDGWNVPIEKCTYTIVLPDQPQLSETDYKVFSFKDKSISKNVIKYNWDGYLTGKANRSLEKNEGLQIELVLPKDYITSIPSTELDNNTSHQGTRNSDENYSVFPLILFFTLLLGLPLLLFLLFKSKKQSFEPKAITKEIYPPITLTPAEAGFLIDNSADYRDLIALLPYWGKAGLIKIIKTENGDYQLIKLKDITTNVQKYELNFFKRIFKDSDTPLLIDLENKFHPDIVLSTRQLTKHVKGLKLYRKAYFSIYSFINTLSPIVFFFGVLLFSLQINYSTKAIGFCLLAIGILGMLNESGSLKKTDKGEDLYYHLLGFKKFIKEASKKEIKEILERDPIYYEKTIPYAIGLRCIYVWSEKFDDLEIAIPEWYEDKNGLDEILYFPIGEMCSTIEKIFISRPKVKNNNTSKNNWTDSKDYKSSSNSWRSSSSKNSDSSWGWGGSSSRSSRSSRSSSGGFGGSGGSSW